MEYSWFDFQTMLRGLFPACPTQVRMMLGEHQSPSRVTKYSRCILLTPTFRPFAACVWIRLGLASPLRCSLEYGCRFPQARKLCGGPSQWSNRAACEVVAMNHRRMVWAFVISMSTAAAALPSCSTPESNKMLAKVANELDRQDYSA